MDLPLWWFLIVTLLGVLGAAVIGLALFVGLFASPLWFKETFTPKKRNR